MLTFQADYSQDQEVAADQFGLVLLNKHFGHAGGSTEFFVRLAKKADSHIPYLLASHPHPHPEDRIKNLKEFIAKNHYPVDQTEPLALESPNFNSN